MLKSEGLIRRVTTIATGLLLAALLAVLVLLWGARPAEAAFPGANGKIVFAGRVMRTPYEGQDEIFKMNPDGSNATRLTHNTGRDYDPAWSSDGQKIAFTREEKSTGWYGEIYIMGRNGDRLTRLTNTLLEHDISPAWSPDGQKIAFVSYRDGDPEIYVMDTDPSTDDATNITNNHAYDDSPDWSPNGKKIAFAKSGEIWVMNKDSSGLKRLTKKTTDFAPAWSPNGRKIAFMRATPDQDWEIFVMNKDGSGQKRLTDNERDDVSPDWQPIVP